VYVLALHFTAYGTMLILTTRKNIPTKGLLFDSFHPFIPYMALFESKGKETGRKMLAKKLESGEIDDWLESLFCENKAYMTS